MAEATIIFKQHWVKEPTNLSNCSACEDIIFSDMNVPVFKAGDITACVDIVLCDSCYNAIEHEEKN